MPGAHAHLRPQKGALFLTDPARVAQRCLHRIGRSPIRDGADLSSALPQSWRARSPKGEMAFCGALLARCRPQRAATVEEDLTDQVVGYVLGAGDPEQGIATTSPCSWNGR